MLHIKYWQNTPATTADFYIDGHKMPLVSLWRDLGVIVSQDFILTAHTKQMVASAHRRANAILRSFVLRDTDILVRAFNVYVLPLV